MPLDVVDVYEFRSDPRCANERDRTNSSSSKSSSESGGGGSGGGGPRAYALGIGVRGRTAIRSVDEALWRSVKEYGRECERFRLYFNSEFNIKLRDVEDGIEPSLLIYQTDLCAALLNELDDRTRLLSYTNDVRVNFDSRVSHIDLTSSMITLTMDRDDVANAARCVGPYDLIVGCDGSNSIVRDAIMSHSPSGTFACARRKLYPGCFKVARAEEMPPLLDPNSVALILPERKSSGITAFVEPTVDGGACILFAGRFSDDALTDDETETIARSATAVDVVADLGTVLFPRSDAAVRGIDASSSSDINRIVKLVIEQFPLLEGTIGIDDIVRQLLNQRTSVADSVKCNTYNSNRDVTPTAICGDAAHATGGVSGQGANSALVDSAALADCLIRYYMPPSSDSYQVGDSRGAKRILLHESVSSYSRIMVPEGLALYDLSFGNDGKTLPILKNIRSMISNVIDGVFGGRFGIGKKPLQTLLASSSKSFVEIRRDRNDMYVDDFPSDEALRLGLDQVYSSVETIVNI
jgi:kynurenine 3-monooxygenase